MLKRLSLFAAAITISVAAVAQSWKPDLDLANSKLAEADRYLQTALSAKTELAAISALQQANTAYKVAKTLYDQVADNIEYEARNQNLSPRKLTDYGDAQRNSRRAEDGITEATAEMMERIKNRGGARSQR